MILENNVRSAIFNIRNSWPDSTESRTATRMPETNPSATKSGSSIGHSASYTTSASPTDRIASKMTSTTNPSASGVATTSRDTTMTKTATVVDVVSKSSLSFCRGPEVKVQNRKQTFWTLQLDHISSFNWSRKQFFAPPFQSQIRLRKTCAILTKL
jgi:hypothetical protein